MHLAPVDQVKNTSNAMEKSDRKSINHTLQCRNSAGEHKIVFREWGNKSDHAIICIHGLTGNGSDFDFLAPHLVKNGYRVIAVDLAGRGLSDFLADPLDYNYQQYIQDITDVLNHLKLNKPGSVDWLGVSLGGLLGIRIAGEENSPIRRLILNDVGPEVPKNALRFIYNVIRKRYLFMNIDTFEKRLRMTRGLTWGPVTDEQWQHMAQNNNRKSFMGLLTYAYDRRISTIFKKHPTGGVDLWPYWDAITCPTLVLHGAFSAILTEKILEKMKDTAKNFTLSTHTFEGCGHVPSLMAHNQIKVIEEWLEKTKS